MFQALLTIIYYLTKNGNLTAACISSCKKRKCHKVSDSFFAFKTF